MLSKLKYLSKKNRDAFLKSDDISECPICGNITMWLSLDKETGEALGANCTKCGFYCGNAIFIDNLLLKIEEVKIAKKIRKGEW